ncbi:MULTISPECIES: DUF262 domain-containing protein [unclassified Sphingobacterium]|uniref:GmrSD restriction endonuclease domain-containing protein n=1 Tax=unclassified Sphingobacterium TaxID=2609468 RepID=UPI00104737ED|nr:MULTISPECIES: DUF262 domain-containing protein [unclassified Sphingobacterium]MCS3557274.1 hypothetical protein [Sphingobacterium sp. JUb21]TCQ96812.1 uncharacterized protein DUF1524 [Sphingobacterium sp. JUb20]
METTNLNKSLEQIFQSKYIVPLYQRNYAWDQDEIEQLLQDLYENFKKSQINSSLNYFIGSLVVLKRKDGFYEVIDGQQRLTTLSLLLKIIDKVKEPKLFYESRLEVEAFFDSYYRNGNTKDVTFNYKVSHLINAVDLLQQTIVNPDERKQKRLFDIEDFEKFKNFVFQNVILVRVEIPQDTDVASYFEIMNNRGEQLQKHEILKSYLMETLKDKDGNYFEKQQDEFSKIWDACSQMDTHIQKLFSAEVREKYFGENYDEIHEVDFQNEETIENIGVSINQALDKISENTNSIQIDDIDDAGKDQSIIDFSNFLMHIFKIKYKTYLENGVETEIPLNEKDLIVVYNGIINLDAKDFINDLLYYRTVFDRFIIKATEEENEEEKYRWTLQKPYKYLYEKKNRTSLKFKNIFENQDRLSKSISLLQVTFRNKKYKNWLQSLLNYFFDKEKFTVKCEDLQYFIDQLILEYYDTNINFDQFDQGVKVPHFLFNFIDYLYWVKIPSDFKFTYRNSVEHHLPQSYKNEINETLLDNLGNLCLVSKSSNSKMNNEHPVGKAAESGKYYRKNLPPKQKIMYNLTNLKNKWGNDEIEIHKNEIVELLSRRRELLN